MSARILDRVVETSVCTGDGSEANPWRALLQYWDEEGNFLAERDTWNAPPATSTHAGPAAAPSESADKP